MSKACSMHAEDKYARTVVGNLEEGDPERDI
jgi:hypothetical protein